MANDEVSVFAASLKATILPVSGAPTTWTLSDDPGSTLSGTDGNDQLGGAAQDITLMGGKGDDTYFVWDHSNVVIEGAQSGIDTIVTYGLHGYSLAASPNVENLTLLGDARSSARGNDLANLIIGNDANNLIDGGLAGDVLTGGGGHDTFVVRHGQGSDTITDFETGKSGDTLALDGFHFQDFADVAAAMRQVGPDAILDLGDGASLTLRDTAASSLSVENVSLGIDTGALTSTFFDDFDSFERFSDGEGTWRTRFEWWGDGAFTLSRNGEQQIYVDLDFKGLTGHEAANPLGYNPFSIEDGKLVITAEAIDAHAAATGTSEFTSGMISSQSSFWQTYGYFEVTAELPEGAGAWPAFWLLPVDNSWPPEIDVLEAFGDQPNQVHSAVIGSSGAAEAWSQVDTSGGAHRYGVLWTPYEITFYVDGVEMMSTPTTSELHDPMYLLANLAVGGPWAGDADPTLSAEFKIDSIAVYQLPQYTLEHYTLRETAANTRYFQGTNGNDTVHGSDGNDTINGRLGSDTLIGGAGDDSYIVNSKSTLVVEAFDGGIDEVRSSMGFTLPDHVENLYLVGNNGAKDATGNALPNIIVGNGGNNVITGGHANDILTGGGGADTFVFERGDGSDIITDFEAGASGHDVVRLDDYGFSTFEEVRSAMTQVGDDTCLALNSFETLVFRDRQVSDFVADDFLLPDIPPESQAWIRANLGTAAADTMLGSASNERFEGKGGADTFKGGIGDDTYLVDNDEQQVVERAREGIDTVETYISFTLADNVENLKLLSAGTVGTGNELANRLIGSSGHDVLNGKGGNDYLLGGGGDDVFVFEAGNGTDTIGDFNAHAGEADAIRFVGYGNGAYLTNAGADWSIHYSGGVETFHLAGVTALSPDDYVFA
ncbi:MAG: family 16 glycosylhydrolase [Hyphomicrobiales bacterium]|nr:family 16 glycosylhydrolase [Hyphomicrobiales bacterium]